MTGSTLLETLNIVLMDDIPVLPVGSQLPEEGMNSLIGVLLEWKILYRGQSIFTRDFSSIIGVLHCERFDRKASSRLKN